MNPKLKSRARRALLKAGELLRNEAYEQAPQVSTDLSRSIIVQRDGDLSVAVGPTVDYGLYVHEGTGLHGPKKAKYRIAAKRKKALRFKGKPGKGAPASFSVVATRTTINAGDVTVRSVMHPGIEANPFMDRAWDKVADEANAIIADEIGDEVANGLVKILKSSEVTR